jgi:hypothetical protein
MPLGPSAADPVRVASTAPVQSAPSADPGGAEWMVSISSHGSEPEAHRALQQLEQRFASLGVKGGDVQKAELGARGTFYRARLAAGTKDQAMALCRQIKAQHLDCWELKR